MFTDHYMRQRGELDRSGQPSLYSYPPLSRKDPKNPRHGKDSKPLVKGPPCRPTTDLRCKSRINLSQLRQQALPSRVRTKQPSRSQASKRTQGAVKTVAGQRLQQSMSPQYMRRQSCPTSTQPTLHKRHQSQSMPEVLKSTKPPVVYSPQHSLKNANKSNSTKNALPKVPYNRYDSIHSTDSSKVRRNHSSHRRGDSFDSAYSHSPQVSIPSRSSDSPDLSIGMDSLGLESKSNYSYVYDYLTVPSMSSKNRKSKKSSTSGKTTSDMLSPTYSSDSHKDPWRKMAGTICMGEGVMFEDEEGSTISHSDGRLKEFDSIGDSESYQDSYSQDLEEFNEGDFEDDLTDLDSDDGEDGSLIGSCMSRGRDPFTVVQRELDNDSHKSSLDSRNQDQVRSSRSYQGALLVAEIERRRQRDFVLDEPDSPSHVPPSKSEDSDRRYRMKLFSTKTDTQHEEVSQSLPPSEASLSRQPQSLSYQIRETRPVQSVSEVTPDTKTDPEGSTRHIEIAPSSPLTPSMFPDHLPPTIHFPLYNERYTPLPRDKRALLKWKMSTITPNVVKNCIGRVGFTKCTKGTTWLGYWGKHMKAESFKTIKEYQKVNHFPGTFEIGRKDRLWRNLSRLQARVGKKDLGFVPQTYVLPQDIKQLRKEWDEGGTKQKWILKPPAAARGIGIRVVSRWGQIPKKRPVVVQRYLSDPYLINGSKFDLRVYVYVSCYDPLRIYVFKEGLARFATCKYSSAMKHLSNRFMHLTNYSINKRNSEFTPNTDETVCQGHKWGLLALWNYMSSELGVDTDSVWESITDLVVKTIICSESVVASGVKAHVKSPYCVHELFGFDVMLDRHLKPWIIEVNISPSLHSNSQLDVNIKGRLVRDLFNITGFYLPTKEVLTGEHHASRHILTTEERIKHSNYMQKSLPQAERRKVLDSLTNDDLIMLMKSEDELSRCGHFERVYPCSNYDKFRRFFEVERYYNILLGEWAAKYQKFPRKGISLLQKQSKQLTQPRK